MAPSVETSLQTVDLLIDEVPHVVVLGWLAIVGAPMHEEGGKRSVRVEREQASNDASVLILDPLLER